MQGVNVKIFSQKMIASYLLEHNGRQYHCLMQKWGTKKQPIWTALRGFPVRPQGRHPRGAWRDPLSAASFRTWHGSQASIAQDLPLQPYRKTIHYYSPIQKKKAAMRHSFLNGGERGIRTLGTVSRTHAFQACTFNRSVISPVVGNKAIILKYVAEGQPRKILYGYFLFLSRIFYKESLRSTPNR